MDKVLLIKIINYNILVNLICFNIFSKEIYKLCKDKYYKDNNLDKFNC